MILHLSTTSFKITDSNNRELTIDEARKAWETGQVTDCNLGFQRLAQCHDFDVSELEAFYDREEHFHAAI